MASVAGPIARQQIVLVGVAVLLAACGAQTPAGPSPAAITDPSPTITAPAEPPTRIPGASSPSPSPTAAPSTSQPADPAPSSVASPAPGSITILFDNVAYDRRLRSGWGFSALVEYGGETVLFDTGADGRTLLANMRTLGVDPAGVRQVVLSHAHTDHTGGLIDFLAASSRPTVFLLSTFGSAYVRGVRSLTTVTETAPGTEIAPGIFTTGRVSGSVAEQALAIRTPKGLVVVTGCAHPGIDRMVKAAMDLSGEPVYMVVGGFHLADSSRARITAVLEALRSLGVRKVAPSHCTGEPATAMFAAEYGPDFVRSGLGRVIPLDG